MIPEETIVGMILNNKSVDFDLKSTVFAKFLFHENNSMVN